MNYREIIVLYTNLARRMWALLDCDDHYYINDEKISTSEYKDVAEQDILRIMKTMYLSLGAKAR